MKVQAVRPPSKVSVVAVVDDDDSVRVALGSLLRSVGYVVYDYNSPRAFLDAVEARQVNCLILDVRMPVLSGLDLQLELSNSQIKVPIVFMTGYGDVPMTVQAMKAGALNFLSKPFREEDMLEAVSAGVRSDLIRRQTFDKTAEKLQLFDGLTSREREVMLLATAGLMNKQIAFKLHLSEITIKTHRSKLMRKMKAETFADLVRLSQDLGLHASR